MNTLEIISAVVLFLSIFFYAMTVRSRDTLRENAETLLKNNAYNDAYKRGFTCALDGRQKAEDPVPPDGFERWFS